MKPAIALAVALIACGGKSPGTADPAQASGVAIAVEDASGHGLEQALHDVGAKHQPDLDRAAGGRHYMVRLRVVSIDSDPKTTCKVAIEVDTLPVDDLIASSNGAASVDGSDSTAFRDCVSATLDDLIVTKVEPALRAR